jgi:hypothetical protein
MLYEIYFNNMFKVLLQFKSMMFQAIRKRVRNETNFSLDFLLEILCLINTGLTTVLVLETVTVSVNRYTSLRCKLK